MNKGNAISEGAQQCKQPGVATAFPDLTMNQKPSVTCKRGTVSPPRDRTGHCLCALCKAAIKAGRGDRKKYVKAWRDANPERISAYQRKWKSANKAKARAIERAWVKAHPEKVAEINRRAGKKWAANNKGHRLAIVRARQLAKRKRTPQWADKQAIRIVYERAAALTLETGVPHEVDHIYPLQGELVSGLHVHNNLQVLTRSENRRKGTKLCIA